MLGILEKAKQLNTESIIRKNFEMLKASYKVNNILISQETKIPIKELEKIDKEISVAFNIYEKIAEYFGIYTSDLFSEYSLRPIAGIFFRHKEDDNLSIEERRFILKLYEWGLTFREVNPVKETDSLKFFRKYFKNIRSEKDIEEKGNKFRELISFHLLSLQKIENLDTWKIKNFFKDFEKLIYKKLGVKIFHVYPSNKEIKFQSIYFPDLEIIFIKDPRYVGTVFFRLFHELFHVFRKDKIEGFDICFGSEVRHPEDKYANRFAAAVLIPINDLESKVKKINIENCKDIEKLYKEYIGSKETFKNRLKSLGIKRKEISNCINNIKAKGKPISIGNKDKIPPEIKKSIEQLYKNGLITYSRKQELLDF
ncbi:Zn-dependent peptidase ImmA, M78 family [Persephonella hydrogeniphila]|uniref:Zn-dependent peptidase ImmA, M78 family n=1 Tax=Persephonella hydrogeniphila TaxID=198703 RepID=A0A285NFJ8_9AQUI|nr:ImmA/IrrE family metallo-endopeptidase [Persephonella hydrogeniphila]SNZ08282.1 Zn-dependent peptidase ImmA, M78 family [Persephonella hydrogeniphila]